MLSLAVKMQLAFRVSQYLLEKVSGEGGLKVLQSLPHPYDYTGVFTR